MKVCTCFVLFKIFAYTNSITQLKPKIDLRFVNQAIENITSTIDENEDKKHVTRAETVETLTDFIQEAVNILNTYEDTIFDYFFYILDKEIRKYQYGDCKFSELTQNYDTRSILAGALRMIRGKSIYFTKAKTNEIADMLSDNTYSNDVKELLDYINSLYKNTGQKFHRVLKELKHYKENKSIKTHNELVQVIRRSLRDILFDHYTALNIDTRRELKARIEKFWKRFKNNPASGAEMNDNQEMNAVSESVLVNISEIVVNDDEKTKLYPKNDTKTNLRSKRPRNGSTEIDYRLSQDDEPEKDKSYNEFDKQNTDFNIDDISSGQSLDSSSNSIKQSQERHAKYNTQRYMTLYTEEISFKARMTAEPKIRTISTNEVIKRVTVPKPLTNTSKYSSEDESNRSKTVKVLRTNHLKGTKQDISNSDQKAQNVLMVKSRPEQRTRQDVAKQRKHFKPGSRSKSKHTNTHFIGEYNAVIDVRLAKSELLQPLVIFNPVPVKSSRHDTTSYQRSFKKTRRVPTKRTTKPRVIRAVAKTRPKKTEETGRPIPPSGYSKPFNHKLKSISTLLSEESGLVKQLKKVKKLKRTIKTRRNANGTVVIKDYKRNFIKRIETLEMDLQELKHMNDLRKRKNFNVTDEVVSNVTDNFKAYYKVGNERKDMNHDYVKLIEENQDTNKTGPNNENSTWSTTYVEPTGKTKDTAKTTVTEGRIKSPVTNEARALNKYTTNVIETTVTVTDTDAAKVEAVRTAATTEVSGATTGYSEPDYEYYETSNETAVTLNPVKVKDAREVGPVVNAATAEVTRAALGYSERDYEDYFTVSPVKNAAEVETGNTSTTAFTRQTMGYPEPASDDNNNPGAQFLHDIENDPFDHMNDDLHY